ncbi:4a-hydroxytetrahydrobiopterin dehydratase [Roseateles sp.]|uniref:4a-hydroxytetrahydrobiopterin dehydratase n=1 Tax=Roseateles sp. TaxID=1971397 RepID=UPI003BA79543
MSLLTQQCRPGLREPVAAQALPAWLAQLPEWRLSSDAKSIELEARFADFSQTMAFVNAVAELAQRQDHHPEMRVGYGHCGISFSTHSASGLTLNDFICAAQVSALPQLKGRPA